MQVARQLPSQPEVGDRAELCEELPHGLLVEAVGDVRDVDDCPALEVLWLLDLLILLQDVPGRGGDGQESRRLARLQLFDCSGLGGRVRCSDPADGRCSGVLSSGAICSDEWCSGSTSSGVGYSCAVT